MYFSTGFVLFWILTKYPQLSMSIHLILLFVYFKNADKCDCYLLTSAVPLFQ